MTTRFEIIGVSTWCFILCVGLSSAGAAHPQAETDVSNDRGSQGNQELIKGESIPKKGEEGKVDETKLKEETKSAKEEFDRKNAKGQQEMSEKSRMPHKTLQNN
jgi:hypothetical protein